MNRIGIRELRQHASVYLKQVANGETIEITDRGRLVAFLVSANSHKTQREVLIANKIMIPAKMQLELPKRMKSKILSDQVITDIRSERKL